MLHTTLVNVDPPETRRRASAAIFGNRAAAEVIGAIEALTMAGEAAVTTRMVAVQANLGDSVVRPVMLRLLAADAVRPQPRVHGSRSALRYEVQHSELWAALRAVTAALRIQEPDKRRAVDLDP